MNEKDAVSNTTALSKAPALTPEDRAHWVKRFVDSGLSLREFSSQNGLCHVSLWRWVHQQNKPARPREPAAPEFAEIQFTPAMAAVLWVAEWSLPNGSVLRLSKDVPAPMLQVLLGLC
jgi:transposase-like protein